jgi:tetratricopeptide (TPR) repeat protein
VVAWASQQRSKYPDDPRFEVLQGVAHALVDEPDEALRWLRQAASHPIDDADFVATLAEQLDALGRFDESLALLERAARTTGDIEFERAVVGRLYQAGRFEQAALRLSRVRLDDNGADVELLAMRAMTLMELDGRHAEVQAVRETLKHRGRNDLRARLWLEMIDSVFSSDSTPARTRRPDDKRIIEACQGTLRIRPNNPYARFHLGEALARVGESDAAMSQWKAAMAEAPAWATPPVRISRLLLEAGYPTHARAMAEEALRRASDHPEALLAAASAGARLVVSGHAGDGDAAGDDVLKLLQRVRQGGGSASSEPAVVALVAAAIEASMLVETGRREQAAEVIDASLAAAQSSLSARTRASASVSGRDALLTLASLSARAGLGLEQRCYEACERLYGPTPELAFERAAYLMRSTGVEQAISSLDASQARAGAQADPLEWSVARARLLDLAGDPRAAGEWMSLADANPDDARVQRLASDAPTVRAAPARHEFRRRAIDRIARVVGEEGLRWRLADAELLMERAADRAGTGGRNRSSAELVRAAASLSEICRKIPNVLRARLLLTECMIRLGQDQEAIEQLSAAAKLDPGSNGLAIRLAGMLQARGAFEQAMPHLERVERNLKETGDVVTPADQQTRRSLARLWAQQGESARAVAVLAELSRSGHWGDDHDTGLQLGQLYRRRGELTDEYCRQLLTRPTAEAIAFVADFYAEGGRRSDAEQLLARLDDLAAADGRRELLLGEYFARHGSDEQAIEHLTAATRALPGQRATWQRLIAWRVWRGHVREAIEAVRAAAERLPEDAAFAALRDNASLVEAVAELPSARQLIVAAAEAPECVPAVIDALTVIRDAARSDETVTNTAKRLRPIADRNSRLLPLHTLVASLYLAERRTDEAFAVASRAMHMFPNDATVAQLAIQALSESNRWAEVVAVARQWRARLANQPLPADLAIASAYLQLQDAKAAVQQLRPHIDRRAVGADNAHADRADDWPLVALYVQAQVAAGSLDDASAVLWPLVQGSAQARAGWLRIAGQQITDAQTASDWLRRVTPLLPSDSLAEQLALAQAWTKLGTRFNDAEHLEVGRRVLESTAPLQSAPHASAADRLAVAQLWQEIHARSGAQADEHAAWQALQRAAAAMEQAPPDQSAAELWLSLGMMLERHDPRAAENAYRHVLKRDPQNAIAKNNLAMVITSRDGDVQEALQLTMSATASVPVDHPLRPAFLDSLARVQVKLSDFDRAVTSLQEAVRIEPGNVKWRINLTQVLISGRRYAQAKSALDEIERLVPKDQIDENTMARLKSLRVAVQ